MIQNRLYIIALLLSMNLAGCATVNRGITDYFRIDSVPQGAKATTSIETSASKAARRKNKNLKPIYHGCEPTPCAIPLYRKSEFVVTLSQEGYETAEMFITNSRASGSFTANMATTAVTTTGTMAAGSAMGAAAATATASFAASVTGAIAGATANLYTFGLVPLEAGVSTGISLFSAQAPVYSSSAAASSAIPPALIVTGGMLVTDAVTGANINLYPNPVVLKMAPQGQATKTDPNVPAFKKVLAAEEQVFKNCRFTKKQHPSQKKSISKECQIAKSDLNRQKSERKKRLAEANLLSRQNNK